MTHDTAVRTIVSLVPEIEKKGAEAVLLNHAEVENLPPAQLEKLAQVFNTLRTLDHIDKQANTDSRGDAIPLVDVPTLVTNYINATKQVKKAAPVSSRVSSHDTSVIDLMSVVRFDVKPLAKEAAAPSPSTPRIRRAELASVALDLEIDARVAMEKLAGELLNKLPKLPSGSLDMRDAIADARYTCDESAITNSIEWLKSASRAPLSNTSLDVPMVKRAFAHTGECGKLLVAFNYELATHTLMKKIAATVDDNDVDGMTPEEAEAELNAILGGMSQADARREIGTGEPVDRPAFVQDNEDESQTSNSNETTSSGEGPPPSTSKPPEKDNRMNKVLSALGAPIRGAGKVVSDTANYAQGQIDRITSKDRTNKDQMKSDVDVEDIRRAIGIRRMIGTDPVLREADPREVLEIYNAISRTNPEIAHNMPALRLLLREAVSYEGLTLDSQKQLTDIRSNSSKSEGQEADNLKRRYSVSGGDSGAKPRK